MSGMTHIPKRPEHAALVAQTRARMAAKPLASSKPPAAQTGSAKGGGPEVTVTPLGNGEYEVKVGYRYTVYPDGHPEHARIAYWPPFAVSATHGDTTRRRLALGVGNVSLRVQGGATIEASARGLAGTARRDRISVNAAGAATWEPISATE